MQHDGPIGVFDSGVGGLSVLHELQQCLPNEAWIYVADSGNCPYGGRGDEFVQMRARSITDFMIEQAVKAIVVACNTATAAAVPMLRADYDLPIIGMEPAIKPAVAATRTGVIGVLTTVGTSRSERLTSLIERFGRGVSVLTQPCPGLVEQVEAGELDSPCTHALLKQYAGPLIRHGADVLVLGCTHYPFLRPALHAWLGPNITLIDTGAAVARQTERVLSERSELTGSASGTITFWTSGSIDISTATIRRLWPTPLAVHALPAAIALT